MNQRLRSNLVTFLFLSLAFHRVDALHTTNIKVCTNKDCLKRFPSSCGDSGLIQTMHDILPPNQILDGTINIESSGCLENCGKGPNVCLQDSSSGQERVFSSVSDLQTAAAIMEVGAEIDCPIPLLVAVQAMAKAVLAQDTMKRVEALDLIINDLVTSQDYSKSAAFSHALILRADAYMETQPPNIEQARKDVDKAIELINSKDGVYNTSSEALIGRTWRIKADIEEASGNILEAMAAVSKWAESSPMFRTKAEKELSRLSITRGRFGGKNINDMNP